LYIFKLHTINSYSLSSGRIESALLVIISPVVRVEGVVSTSNSAAHAIETVSGVITFEHGGTGGLEIK
jgi:hypothetical protein